MSRHRRVLFPAAAIHGKPDALFLVLALLVFLGGCAGKQASVIEPIQVVTQTQAPFDPSREIQNLIRESKGAFNEGVALLGEGHNDEAFASFDFAVALILECQNDLSLYPELSYHYQHLLDLVFDFERMRYGFEPEDLITYDTSTLEKLLDDALVDLELNQIDQALGDEGDGVEYDMPIITNRIVDRFIEAFTTRREPIIRAALERSTQYLPMMRQVFKEEGLPLDLCYLPLIESGYRSVARSRARAMGMWQFMEGTARNFGLKVDWWEDQRLSPEMATRAAARYLKALYEEFGDWNLALCGYNAGEGRVRRAIRKGKTKDFWVMARHRLLPRETIGYIPAFMAGVQIAKNPEAFGFKDLQFKSPVAYDKVDVQFPLELDVLAEELGLEKEVLREMNTEYVQNVTPRGSNPSQIKVPFGLGDQAREAIAHIPPSKRTNWTRYHIKRGDTLGRIANRFGTTVQALMLLNKIRNPRGLQIGQQLLVPLGKQDVTTVGVIPDPENPLAHVGQKMIEHRIRRGDTLSFLARRYQTSIPSLLELNNNLDPLALRPGMTLRVRQGDRFRSSQPELPNAKPASSKRLYAVKRGDSLFAIAQKHKVELDDLMAANGLDKRAILQPGQQLQIPEQGKKTKVVTYTIRRGDTLSKIARKYGVTVQKIMEWNRLPSSHRISAGQRLVIYL